MVGKFGGHVFPIARDVVLQLYLIADTCRTTAHTQTQLDTCSASTVTLNARKLSQQVFLDHNVHSRAL